MKKLILATVLILTAKVAVGQDTLLFEDFNTVINYTYEISPPSGYAYDTAGYNFDGDGLTDANARDMEWFFSLPFADADLYLPGTSDTNVVLSASSWFDSPGQALNYFILPSIYLSSGNGVLSWKSAPRQTPKYCDGYKVLVSTTNNFETSFTDTLFVGAEYTGEADPLPDSTYAGYQFSQGFVHGQDGTYIEYDGDSARFKGILRPFSVNLSQYSGQKIFIGFLQDAFDDNLISIDDILVFGDGTVDVNETKAEIEVSMYPNPATTLVNLNFNVVKSGPVSVYIYDLSGRIVEKRSLGARMKGQHTAQVDVNNLAAGSYLLTLHTVGADKTLKLMVTK